MEAEETSLSLPINKNKQCQYCKNYRIDLEILSLFNKRICYDCKFSKLHLITKTTVIQEFLLNNDDIKDFKYLSRPNPGKGTWHNMQLYDLDQIEEIVCKKYGSLEKMQLEKQNRKQDLLNRKKRKVRSRIKELRKKILIEDKLKHQSHQHEFIFKNGKSRCNCGMVLESEEI